MQKINGADAADDAAARNHGAFGHATERATNEEIKRKTQKPSRESKCILSFASI